MGGKAFEGKTQRIKQADINTTLATLSRATGRAGITAAYMELHLLGSAGKNDDSGDIDINVDETKYDINKLAAVLIEQYGEENVKPRIGNKQIFCCIPIQSYGRKSPGNVQIDFMFGDVAWQKFSYYSAKVTNSMKPGDIYNEYSDQSRFKGLFRTELIKAVVAFNSTWVLEDDDGSMIARVGPTFFHDRGLVYRYRYRPFKKGSTTERVKALKEVTREEFLEVFPTALTSDRTAVMDLSEVAQIILHTDLDYSSNEHVLRIFRSFESTWQQLYYAYDYSQLRVISKIYLERLNSLKVDIPKEILRELPKGTK